MTTGKAMRRILDDLDEWFTEYNLIVDWVEEKVMVCKPTYPFTTWGYIEDGHFYDY